MIRNLSVLTLSLAVCLPATAAPSTVKVDARGRLVIPAAVVKKLGVAPAKDGLVELQFADVQPKEPEEPKGTGGEHSHPLPKPRPPQTWVHLQRDGSVLLARTRVSTHQLYVPGKPGTTYVLTGEKNRIILRSPAPKAAPARGSSKPGRR